MIAGLTPCSACMHSAATWLGDVPVKWQMRLLRNQVDMR